LKSDLKTKDDLDALQKSSNKVAAALHRLNLAKETEQKNGALAKLYQIFAQHSGTNDLAQRLAKLFKINDTNFSE